MAGLSSTRASAIWVRVVTVLGPLPVECGDSFFHLFDNMLPILFAVRNLKAASEAQVIAQYRVHVVQTVNKGVDVFKGDRFRPPPG